MTPNTPGETNGMKHHVLKVVLVVIAAILVATLASLIISHVTYRQNESGARVTIQIEKDGFNPAVMTIRSGTTVTWQNTDSAPHHVTSTPFPAHTDLPALDSHQNIGPAGSYSYTFTKTGSFGFVDYLHPAFSGKIIVK